MQGSLEDDLSHVVGLSFEFWVVIVAFLLVAGPAGFAVGYLMAGTAALLVVVNAKLAQIIRSVTTREWRAAAGGAGGRGKVGGGRGGVRRAVGRGKGRRRNSARVSGAGAARRW